jgi:hypothetical protein
MKQKKNNIFHVVSIVKRKSLHKNLPISNGNLDFKQVTDGETYEAYYFGSK